MKTTDEPNKFPIPWANNAGPGYIRNVPTDSQIGLVDGAASLHDGWVPLNFIAESVGGVAPSGKEDNGIKNQITANIRWHTSGMFAKYDASFSSAIGGYPNGALLQSANLQGFWQSTIDDNTSNPETGGAHWEYRSFGNYPGTVIYVASSSVPYGYLAADGSEVSRTTYAALFAVTGVIFGSGDGSSTFNLPDLRAEFIRGLDSGRGIDTGRAIGTSQAADIAPHQHSLPWRASGQYFQSGLSSYTAIENFPHGSTYDSVGTETRPRNVALLACIKY